MRKGAPASFPSFFPVVSSFPSFFSLSHTFYPIFFSLLSLFTCYFFRLRFSKQKTHPPPLKATDLTRPPITFTAGNKSFPWQLHSWVPPNKNTMLGALGRAVGAVVNSSDPLHETKALSQGLGLSTSETAALIKGQSDVVTYVSSVNASPSPAGDLRCFVDPATGQLLGLEQSGTAACSVASDVVVVVPLSTGSYISQVKLAYTYDGAFVGRLVFELKADATAKAVSYTCGSAGGKAVSLLPSDRDFVVTKVAVGCAPLPAIDGGIGGSGRRLQASLSLGLSAGSFGVTAAPLSVLPVDPATGIPRTPSLGDFLAPSPTVVNATSPASGRIDVSFTRREFYMPPNAPTMGAAAWSSSMELTVTFQASSR